MNTEAFHPDQLKPGDMVGPWRILESLGSGSCGRALKVEYEGELFTLKIAVRPAPELPPDTSEKAREERQVDGRMSHEGALLLANSSHPGLPHLRAVGRWPHPKRGYLFFVTDYVSGVPFHDWREKTRPSAAQLVDLFIEVVRVVARLHGRGIFIRDFKSEHVIVPEDLKPVLVDMGSAWLPGGSSLTIGLAPGTPYALPPECVSFIRKGTWKQGDRFNVTEAGDLYQLGVFMYEALTDGWPFDPRFNADALLTAIETVVPRAPHRLNPEVPESLSRITLRLLEKRPEDRYPSAEALLQALWDAAKERAKKGWKVPLEMPAEGPAPMTQDEEVVIQDRFISSRHLRLEPPRHRERRHPLGEVLRVSCPHPQALLSHLGTDLVDQPRPGAHQHLPRCHLGSQLSALVRNAVRWPVRSQPTRLRQRPRIPLVRLHPTAARGVHRREVRVSHHHLMPHLLQAPRYPLALRGGLQQPPGLGSLAQQLGQPLPLGGDASLQHHLASLRQHAYLALPLVHVDSDIFHGLLPTRAVRPVPQGGAPCVAMHAACSAASLPLCLLGAVRRTCSRRIRFQQQWATPVIRARLMGNLGSAPA
jgi:serine/threonine protein kinase